MCGAPLFRQCDLFTLITVPLLAIRTVCRFVRFRSLLLLIHVDSAQINCIKNDELSLKIVRLFFLAKFPSIRIRSSKRNTFAFEFMRVDNPQLRIGFWKRFVRLSHSKLICYKFRMHIVRGWHFTFWGFIGEMSMVCQRDVVCES